MKNQKKNKCLIPKNTLRVRQKYICFALTILMLLSSVVGFVPNTYAANTAGLSDTLYTSIPSGNFGDESQGSNLTNQQEMWSSSQNESVTGEVYFWQNFPFKNFPSFAPEKTLTESVYSPDYIDKVICYPETPRTFRTVAKQVYQSDGIHMKQVIHMPRMIIKPDAFSPSVSSVVYEKNSALDQGSNMPSVAESVYGTGSISDVVAPGTGSDYTSPASAFNASAITGLKDDIDEDDLTLVDSAMMTNRDSASNNSPLNSSQPDLNHARIASPGSSASASFPIQNKSGHFTAGFSRQAGKNLLRFSYKNSSLTLNPLNSASVSGSVYKNTITYENIYPDTDIRYTLGKNRLKEDIIVPKYTGINDFTFNVSVDNTVFQKKPDGGIYFLDPVSNNLLFYMPKPYAIDNNGNRCDSVDLEPIGNGLLKLSINPEWLKTAVYPVDIDPAIYLFESANESTGGVVTNNPGILPYWNYTSAVLGGGWTANVNTYNLNTILGKTPFSIPGRGLPIGDSLIYNSVDGRIGSLGYGWRLTTDTSVNEQPDGSVLYFSGDGSNYKFTKNTDGSYTAPTGIYLKLQKDTQGNFTITDKKQSVYTFINGKLQRKIDRNNNTTTFQYDKRSGMLIQQKDPSRRVITYKYNTDGQISTIEYPLGEPWVSRYGVVHNPEVRAYQFGYQNGRLTSVTDPINSTVLLGYDANGRLASFTDPMNRVTTFSFTPDGKIQWYRDARTSGQDIYQTTFAQTFGSSVATTVTDPGNRTAIYYHDINTGNLIQKQDGVGNSWYYTWTNNNLTQSKDTKGTTSYEYDNMGNVTKKTTTVDSNTSNNIIETMTYNSYNDLLTKKDNNDREALYTYDSQGNLLSISNPNENSANSYNYDQYGNLIQYTPYVKGSHNLIQNGSMELPGANGIPVDSWSMAGHATVNRDSSFYPHGNYSLKISNPSSSYCYFAQYFSITGVHPYGSTWAGDALTLKADIKLDNVVESEGISGDGVVTTTTSPFDTSGVGGLIIGFFFADDYGHEYYTYNAYTGNGSATITLPSKVPWIENLGPCYHVLVYIGLKNSSGTASIDGVQLLDNNKSSMEHIIGQFNPIENSGFENSMKYWTPGGNAAVTSAAAWEGSYSLAMTAAGTTYQDVPTHSGEKLTLSGMVKTSGVSGSGACYRVDYYDASNNLISGASVQTGYITGTQGWTRLSDMANAPANANHARIQCILNGSGTAYFDNIDLIPLNSQKYTYDSQYNYMTASEDSLGNRSRYAYNYYLGTQLSATDACNNTTLYAYDALNRLVQVTNPVSRKAYYQYDPASNLIYTRDPRSASSSDNIYSTYYGPNNLDQLSILTDPLNQSASYTYDKSGNLTGVALPNGQSENLTYDNANRLTKVTLSDGRYYNYFYDGAGDLTGVTDQSGASYSWGYDGAHRVTGTTDPLGLAIGYSWDKSGNLTRYSGNYNGGIAYYYDGGNNIYKVALPRAFIYYSRDGEGRVYNVEYDHNYVKNNQLAFDISNRIINYLPNGWCSRIQDESFPNSNGFSYSYNADGTISRCDSWQGTDNYGYDANGRLTSWSPSWATPQSYTYDAAGNLLTMGGRTFTYNSANEITNPGFTYDENGNMTSDGNFKYTYNALNQLVQVNKVSDGSLVATYTYNHDGLRRSKTAYAGYNPGTTNYNWDAFGNLIKESRPDGTYYYYYASGKLISYIYDNKQYLVHDNLRGEIVSTSYTDDYGNSYSHDRWDEYDPWGNTISPPYDSISFRFAGYYYDDETGLYYLKSRYYNPSIGRFLTRDDHKYIQGTDPQTLNLYSYCGNDPVNRTDPTGCDYYGYDENGYDDASINFTEEESSQLNYLKYWWNHGGVQSALHSQALAIRKTAIDRMLASLPRTGTPNSTDRLYKPDGSLKQERVYGPNGEPLKDIDYDHGGAGHVFPHEHIWENGERGEPRPLTGGDEPYIPAILQPFGGIPTTPEGVPVRIPFRITAPAF